MTYITYIHRNTNARKLFNEEPVTRKKGYTTFSGVVPGAITFLDVTSWPGREKERSS